MFDGVFSNLNNGIKNNWEITIIITVIKNPITIDPATDFLSSLVSFAP